MLKRIIKVDTCTYFDMFTTLFYLQYYSMPENRYRCTYKNRQANFKNKI